MPTPFIKKVSEQTGKKEENLEKKYKDLEAEGEAHRARNKYAYATAVLKKETHYHPKKDK